MAGTYGAMNQVRDSVKYKSNMDGEKHAQRYMDGVYLSMGYKTDRSKADWKHDCVIYNDDSKFRVEEKIRNKIYADVAIEPLQSLEIGELGWFYHIDVDYLHYVMCLGGWVPSRFYQIDWPKFKPWFFEWLSRDKIVSSPISSKGNGITLNVSVPICDIPDSLYRYFPINGGYHDPPRP